MISAQIAAGLKPIYLKRFIREHKAPTPQEDKVILQRILGAVYNHTGVSIDDMKSPSRKKELAYARHLTMNLINTRTKILLREIGDMFGGRTHATVLHSCDAAKDLIETDKKFNELHNTINNSL